MTEPRIHERSASLSADVSIKVGEHAGSMLGNAERQVEMGQYAAGIMLARLPSKWPRLTRSLV